MTMRRREFLEKSIVGVGGALLGSRLASSFAYAEPAKKVNPFDKVTLGKTDVKMSRFCLGTGMRGGNRESDQTRMGKDKFEALIRGAHDRGITVYDLADLYGTHPYVIPALKDVPRDQITIISKIWWRPGGIPERERPDSDVVVERFLRELKTDYIDLVLLHCVESPKWPEELRKQMDILEKLKSKKVIRAHGVSCHSLPALQAVIDEPWVDSVHTRINPTGASMDGPVDKVVPVLQAIHAKGKGVVGMKIMGEGRYRNNDELRDKSVNFVLGLGCVDILNVGCESMDEVDDFAARVEKVKAA